MLCILSKVEVYVVFLHHARFNGAGLKKEQLTVTIVFSSWYKYNCASHAPSSLNISGLLECYVKITSFSD